MNGTVAFPILLLQFDKEQLCIGCFHTSYCLLPNASFASNLCTVTYPCFVLCLTPVFVFKYRSTSSQTVICPSTIFTSKSKSVFTCFPTHEGKGMAFCPLEVCPYPHLHSMHPDLLSFLIISFYTVDQLLLRILIQCEYQTAPIPPNQSCLEYPARICLLYVLQSLLPTQPENYILQLIWKEMQ